MLQSTKLLTIEFVANNRVAQYYDLARSRCEYQHAHFSDIETVNLKGVLWLNARLFITFQIHKNRNDYRRPI